MSDEKELLFIELLSLLESVLQQREKLQSTMQQGYLSLLRERTQSRRRLDIDLVDDQLPPSKLVSWSSESPEFALVDAVNEADDVGAPSLRRVLVAIGGALPSQAIQDAQHRFESALQLSVQLANDTNRLNALMQRFETESRAVFAEEQAH